MVVFKWVVTYTACPLKGTKKQAQYKTKCEVFSILPYKYAAFIRSVQKYRLINSMHVKFL